MFAKNLKYLRSQQKYSQEYIAQTIGATRQALIKYEKGISEPKVSTLRKIAIFYKVSIDKLINSDLEKEFNYKGSILDSSFRILTTTIDSTLKEKIELIPVHAQAGYLQGFQQLSYIEQLSTFSLPKHHNGKYRAFEIKGDSMPPIHEHFIVIGKYVESWHNIQPNKRYVLVTKTDGVVFKRVFWDKNNENNLILTSDNHTYIPYSLHASELIEAWLFTSFIGFP